MQQLHSRLACAYLRQGAGVKDIVAKLEAEGKAVPRDAFGHVKLDAINPGKYFADTFSALLGAEKVLVPFEQPPSGSATPPRT